MHVQRKVLLKDIQVEMTDKHAEDIVNDRYSAIQKTKWVPVKVKSGEVHVNKPKEEKNYREKRF